MGRYGARDEATEIVGPDDLPGAAQYADAEDTALPGPADLPWVAQYAEPSRAPQDQA